MKVYKCYRNYPAESADVTIYVREWNVDHKRVIVEFFPKDPLAEPFKKKLCDNFVQGSDIAEEYIKGENFVMEDKEMLKKYQLKRCYNVAN